MVKFVKTRGKHKKLVIFVFRFLTTSIVKNLMKKIIVSVFAIFLLFACKKQEGSTSTTETESREEYFAKNKLNIPKKSMLKELTPTQKKLVQDWLEFTAIHENMKLINSSTRFAIVEDLGQLAANIDTLEKKRFP